MKAYLFSYKVANGTDRWMLVYADNSEMAWDKIKSLKKSGVYDIHLCTIE